MKFGITTWILLGLGAAAAAMVSVVIMSRAGNRAAPMSGLNAPSTATGSTAGPAAAPWAYDSVTKRHYDPGHGHWHDGPPPSSAAGGPATATAPAATAPPPGPAPAPWTFDRAGNRHWDPTHGHWHPGPPPLGAK